MYFTLYFTSHACALNVHYRACWSSPCLYHHNAGGWMDSNDETAIKWVVMATLLPTLVVKLPHKQIRFFKNPWARLCLAAVKRQSPIIHHPHHHKRQSSFQCHVGLLIINVRNHILQAKKTIYNSIDPVRPETNINISYLHLPQTSRIFPLMFLSI